MNEKKLELCGLPVLLLAEVIRSLKDNKKRLFSSSCNLKEVKEVLTKYNIDDNGHIGDDKELQQCVRETKLNTSEQETNNLTSTVSLSSTSTQTMNLSDPKSVCRISSVDPRLSSVSLYCEYELGKAYHQCYSPFFAGYPIVLKSPFRLYETKIITGLDKSKTKFIDNDNYVIEAFSLGKKGDVGYPMIVSCSYGSVTTILKQDKKKILDNNDFDLTFRS
ncbi:5181_t:CDS:2 [Diversispora eburnea]|uniref:5181_t:CDS:1 n=1 Tax=Diversispora eburnea TaxID=1213867 RepID=A0A9N8ZTQ6_9GLOM|nr:5181_t:CDS:2 [Diversispora eburnea]